jgi:lipopolysaccharide/colanic/teichoic acid biosynthesis glycosyltransferase
MPRAADLVIALAALLISLPVMVALALLVRLWLGSPVLFAQVRSGLGGREFRMIKLRTMSDARDPAGELLPDRERTGRFGRLLRRSRLDELPELWNIVKGEMALVGPRPLLPRTIAGMGKPGAERGIVRPGLTGWAQVNGNAMLSGSQKLALDLWYIQNRSFGFDVKVILRTLHVIVAGERINPVSLEEACAGRSRRGC